MSVDELRVRVTVATAVAVSALALLAAWGLGAAAGLGVLASGVLTVANFLWLARGAVAAGTLGRAGAWPLAFGGRLVVLAAGFGLLLASGLAHPVAVVAGATVLPCVVVATGLGRGRAAAPGP